MPPVWAPGHWHYNDVLHPRGVLGIEQRKLGGQAWISASPGIVDTTNAVQEDKDGMERG